jgi:hypothetical protein
LKFVKLNVPQFQVLHFTPEKLVTGRGEPLKESKASAAICTCSSGRASQGIALDEPFQDFNSFFCRKDVHLIVMGKTRP